MPHERSADAGEPVPRLDELGTGRGEPRDRVRRRLEEQHREAVTAALQSAAADAEAIAHVMSAAYFACATDMPEFGALSAALKGDPEMEAAQHEIIDAYVTEMAAALVAHTDLPAAAFQLRCVGVLGAAEAIATELVHGRTTRDAAVDALAELILRGLTTGSAEPRPARPART